MIDTPGLINPNQLTARLTTNELKKVIPIKPINAVTLRIAEGKCVMIGGLAIIKLLEVITLNSFVELLQNVYNVHIYREDLSF
jgi:ribosome biogenesis GTPase A